MHAACRTMFDQLGGYHLVRRIKSDAEVDYVLLFENEVGQRKLVAWTAPPPGGAPDEAIIHDVVVYTDKPLGEGDLGDKSKEIVVKNDAIQLTVGGEPRYVALSAEVDLKRCRSLAPVTTAQNKPTPPPVELPAVLGRVRADR